MNAFQRRFVWVGLLLAGLATIGCEGSSGTDSDMDSLAAQLEQNKKAAADAAAAEQARAAAAQAAAEKAAAEKAAADAAAAEAAAKQAAENEVSFTITVKNPQALLNDPRARAEAERLTAGAATVGQGGGYYSAIVAAHRHITTRVDDLAWTQAVRSFWAEKGHYPRTHEEFMKGVIEAYEIPLEPLEEGQEYYYAPAGSELAEGEFGTLYIVEPNPPGQAPPEQPEQSPPPAE
jgi:hypothetical protein